MPDTSRLIRDGQLAETGWQHLPVDAESLPDGDITVTLSYWKENRADLLEHVGRVGVRIEGGDDPAELADDLSSLPLVVLQIDALVDGRAYSHAYLLRKRLGYQGELRAVGDVHRDQLNFLGRCGINAFELPEGDDIQEALEAFKDYSIVYQPSADKEDLIFARRRSAG
jgi:uncharacterized protein (DUF934 family)